MDTLVHELRRQAAFLKEREPAYGRILALLEEAAMGGFGDRLARLWAGRPFHSVYERPLLLLAALRFDALSEGKSHPLHAAIAAENVRAEVVTPQAVAEAVAPTRTRLDEALAGRAVQTNETTRAVAWLWPAHLVWLSGERRALTLVDLGTSAGLNLVADALPMPWVDEAGHSIPTSPRPPIARRLGLDLAPLDVRQPDDAMWLRACVWPSDRVRLARLNDAIQAFTARVGRDDEPTLERCSMAEAPARLSSLPDDSVAVCLQTIVRDYLAPEERESYEAGMREFLARRLPGSALVVELEVDLEQPGGPERSAFLTCHHAMANGEIIDCLLARTHPHPQQLFIETDGVHRFQAAWRRA